MKLNDRSRIQPEPGFPLPIPNWYPNCRELLLVLLVQRVSRHRNISMTTKFRYFL